MPDDFLNIRYFMNFIHPDPLDSAFFINEDIGPAWDAGVVDKEAVFFRHIAVGPEVSQEIRFLVMS